MWQAEEAERERSVAAERQRVDALRESYAREDGEFLRRRGEAVERLRAALVPRCTSLATRVAREARVVDSQGQRPWVSLEADSECEWLATTMVVDDLPRPHVGLLLRLEYALSGCTWSYPVAVPYPAGVDWHRPPDAVRALFSAGPIEVHARPPVPVTERRVLNNQ